VQLKLSDISIDGGTQPRAAIDETTVAEYAEAMEGGDRFPAVKAVHDGVHYWLVDGWHRFYAAHRVGYLTIEADVITGSLEDAIWLSLGANRENLSLRRTNADKERAVTIALTRWNKYTDGKLAEHIGVSREMVRRHRRQVATVATCAAPPTPGTVGELIPKREGRDGKSYPSTRVTPTERPLPPVSDRLGQVIGNELIAADFRRATEVRILITGVYEVRRIVLAGQARDDRLYRGISEGQLKADVEHLAGTLKKALPHALCPYCGGRGCSVCFQRGWVDKFTLDAAPGNDKEVDNEEK